VWLHGAEAFFGRQKPSFRKQSFIKVYSGENSPSLVLSFTEVYRGNNSPSLVPNLIQKNPIQPITTYCLKIHFNILYHLCLGLPRSPHFRFSNWYCLCVSHIHATCLRISSFLIGGNPNNMWQRIQTMKLSIKQFSSCSCNLLLLRPKRPPQHVGR
jgi:hypothetical protein